MIKLTLQASGFKEIQGKIAKFSKSATSIASPELRRVGEHMRDSVKSVLSTQEFVWHGRLRDSIEVDELSESEIAIIQDDKGLYIQYGFEPQSGAPPGAGWNGRDDGLVEWCMAKFGLQEHDAYGVALKIFQNGILARDHYPSGTRGYNYADYVVNVKERDYLNQAAERIGGLYVKYLDTTK